MPNILPKANHHHQNDDFRVIDNILGGNNHFAI